MSQYQTYVPERRRNLFVRSAKGGRVLSGMMLPWFMLLPPKGWGVLTTTGRKTGKVRRKCVRAIRSGDEVLIVALGPTAWLLNLRANPRVEVRIRGGTVKGFAHVATGEERAKVAEEYCRALVPFDYAGCVMHRPGLPRRSKITALHRQWCDLGVPVVVRLADDHDLRPTKDHA